MIDRLGHNFTQMWIESGNKTTFPFESGPLHGQERTLRGFPILATHYCPKWGEFGGNCTQHIKWHWGKSKVGWGGGVYGVEKVSENFKKMPCWFISMWLGYCGGGKFVRVGGV